MSVEVRRRRGTTTQHASFTGAEGELTVDTTKKAVVVHDAVRAGGYPVKSWDGPRVDPGGLRLSGTVWLDGFGMALESDSKKGTIFACVSFDNAASAAERILANTSLRLTLVRASTGTIQLIGDNAAGTQVIGLNSEANVAAAAGLYNIAVSWDLSASVAHLYVGEAPNQTPSLVNDFVDSVQTELSIGANVTGGAPVTGNLYFLLFDNQNYIDLSQWDNRRKFYDPAGVVVPLGSHGELPLGFAPAIFLGYNNYRTFHKNRGRSNSTFTVNGTAAAPSSAITAHAFTPDVVRMIASSATAVGNVGTGEDDLISLTLPPYTLNAEGKALRITAWGSTANNANAKTVKLYHDIDTLASHALTISQANTWKIEAIVNRVSDTGQDYYSTFAQYGTTAQNLMTLGTGAVAEVTAAVVKITGTATSNNDIVCEGMTVELMGA